MSTQPQAGLTEAQRIRYLEQQVQALFRAVNDLAAASRAHSTALEAVNKSLTILGQLEEEE